MFWGHFWVGSDSHETCSNSETSRHLWYSNWNVFFFADSLWKYLKMGKSSHGKEFNFRAVISGPDSKNITMKHWSPRLHHAWWIDNLSLVNLKPSNCEQRCCFCLALRLHWTLQTQLWGSFSRRYKLPCHQKKNVIFPPTQKPSSKNFP